MSINAGSSKYGIHNTVSANEPRKIISAGRGEIGLAIGAEAIAAITSPGWSIG
jgi:hypothetical protein